MQPARKAQPPSARRRARANRAWMVIEVRFLTPVAARMVLGRAPPAPRWCVPPDLLTSRRPGTQHHMRLRDRRTPRIGEPPEQPDRFDGCKVGY